jgi:hypothetical protein
MPKVRLGTQVLPRSGVVQFSTQIFRTSNWTSAGSRNLLNFGLDPGSGPVQVRTRFEPVFSSHAPDALKILSRSSPASLSFLYCPEGLN